MCFNSIWALAGAVFLYWQPRRNRFCQTIRTTKYGFYYTIGKLHIRDSRGRVHFVFSLRQRSFVFIVNFQAHLKTAGRSGRRRGERFHSISGYQCTVLLILLPMKRWTKHSRHTDILFVVSPSTMKLKIKKMSIRTRTAASPMFCLKKLWYCTVKNPRILLQSKKR